MPEAVGTRIKEEKAKEEASGEDVTNNQVPLYLRAPHPGVGTDHRRYSLKYYELKTLAQAMTDRRNPRVRCGAIEVGDNMELISQLNILEDEGNRCRQTLATLYSEVNHMTSNKANTGAKYGRSDRIISPLDAKRDTLAAYRFCVIECEVSRGKFVRKALYDAQCPKEGLEFL